MGMATRLYGCIVEYGWNPRKDEIYSHNERIIQGLPETDEWPPLSKNMFAMTHNYPSSSPSFDYFGRIIHFGANFKSIEYEWKEWRMKFEDLLNKLLWTSADVHFKPEYREIQTFTWRVDLRKWSIDKDESKKIEPIRPEFWDFTGDAFWDDFTWDKE